MTFWPSCPTNLKAWFKTRQRRPLRILLDASFEYEEGRVGGRHWRDQSDIYLDRDCCRLDRCTGSIHVEGKKVSGIQYYTFSPFRPYSHTRSSELSRVTGAIIPLS